MNPIVTQLTDITQHNPPAVYRGELSQRNVVTAGGARRPVQVLTVYMMGGVQLHYVVGIRPIKATKYGHIVYGQTLQASPGSSDLLLTDARVAVKVSELARVHSMLSQRASTENPFHEIATMQLFGPDHPHLMGQHVSCTTSTNLYTIMPYLECEDIFDYMSNRLAGGFDENDARFIFRQIVTAVRDLHSLNIAHRDLSLENVVICLDPVDHMYKGGRAVVLDFGMSHRHRTDIQPVPAFPVVHYGKRYYYPPEVLQHIEDPTFLIDPRAFDIWALGCMLFLLLTRTPLFDIALPADSTGRFLIVQTNPANGLTLILAHMGFPPLLIDLLQNMLRLDPMQRYTTDSILAHPWMQLPP